MHTHTQTNTPKPNFIRVLKMASLCEAIEATQLRFGTFYSWLITYATPTLNFCSQYCKKLRNICLPSGVITDSG